MLSLTAKENDAPLLHFPHNNWHQDWYLQTWANQESAAELASQTTHQQRSTRSSSAQIYQATKTSETIQDSIGINQYIIIITKKEKKNTTVANNIEIEFLFL